MTTRPRRTLRNDMKIVDQETSELSHRSPLRSKSLPRAHSGVSADNYEERKSKPRRTMLCTAQGSDQKRGNYNNDTDLPTVRSEYGSEYGSVAEIENPDQKHNLTSQNKLQDFESQDFNPRNLEQSFLPKTKLLVPDCNQVRKFYSQNLNKLKETFLTSILQNYREGTREFKTRFAICHNLQYEWQRALLEETFLGKGFELSYHNQSDRGCNVGETTRVDLIIPSATDIHARFYV